MKGKYQIEYYDSKNNQKRMSRVYHGLPIAEREARQLINGSLKAQQVWIIGFDSAGHRTLEQKIT